MAGLKPWRDEIEWAGPLPDREGMFLVRRRGNANPAGHLEVRWETRREGSGFFCWVDGRWHPIRSLVPRSTTDGDLLYDRED